jgi:hypothetical protein
MLRRRPFYAEADRENASSAGSAFEKSVDKQHSGADHLNGKGFFAG